MTPRREKVERGQVNFADLQPITIHFDGSVDRREVAEGREYSMELYRARPGDIVAAKIDLKNGAVGLVPDWENVVVTGHFAVYGPDRSRLVPEFLLLVIQARFFKGYLWRNKVGAEGRKEVKLDFFESALIPLPPLDTQRAIVARWQAARQESDDALARAKEAEAGLLRWVSEELGRANRDDAQVGKAFAIPWSRLSKWGVSMARRGLQTPKEPKYPTVAIGGVCAIGSGGTPPRDNPANYGGDIPWAKTTEVRGEIITDTEEKLTRAGLANSSARLYPAGSIIVAMYGQGATRGRTAKLGIEATTNQACAVLSEFAPQVAPDYVWYYLMSEYDNLRSEASGNNQPNLNAAMIANYPLPLPPLDVQHEILRQVRAGRAEVARLKAQATDARRTAAQEIEEMILGARPPAARCV